MGLLCQWWSGRWVWDSGDNYKGGGRGGLSSGGAGEQACTRWLCQVTDLHEIHYTEVLNGEVCINIPNGCRS